MRVDATGLDSVVGVALASMAPPAVGSVSLRQVNSKVVFH